MRTIDEQFTRRTGRWAVWWRDLRLLIRIAQMLWAYFTDGSRIRRAYRRAQALGETYWLDEELGQ